MLKLGHVNWVGSGGVSLSGFLNEELKRHCSFLVSRFLACFTLGRSWQESDKNRLTQKDVPPATSRFHHSRPHQWWNRAGHGWLHPKCTSRHSEDNHPDPRNVNLLDLEPVIWDLEDKLLHFGRSGFPGSGSKRVAPVRALSGPIPACGERRAFCWSYYNHVERG